MESTTGPVVVNTDVATPEHPPVPATSAETARPRPRRRTLWISIASVAIATAAVGAYLLVQSIQHTEALDAFNEAVSDRADAYADQAEFVTTLHAVEDDATVLFMQSSLVANTLTDDTVADADLRAELLEQLDELRVTASLPFDEKGAIINDMPRTYEAWIPDEDLPLEGLAPAEDTAGLLDQVATLQSDTEAARAYKRLVGDIVFDIADVTVSVNHNTDAVIVSAAEKGATLSWDRAPEQTAAVVAAAAALTAEGAADLPLEERALLVQAYAAAVTTAAEAQQGVLDAEAAEAARQAEEQQNSSQNNGSRSNNNGSWNNGSTNPGNGGTNPGSGGTNPGNNGGTNPGSGGTNPGTAPSNWQPFSSAPGSSSCSDPGMSVSGGSSASYGSTLLYPQGAYDIQHWEISGGWAISWKCDLW